MHRGNVTALHISHFILPLSPPLIFILHFCLSTIFSCRHLWNTSAHINNVMPPLCPVFMKHYCQSYLFISVSQKLLRFEYNLGQVMHFSFFYPSGEGAFSPEDPNVAAGMCRAQQTARSCHVPRPADERCRGRHGSRCSSSRHAHL